MTTSFTEATSAQAVNALIGAGTDPRLAHVMASLARHLHAFARDVQLTKAEWATAVDFLTRTGRICSGERQEFILLSDVLGLSMLIGAMANRHPPGTTESTVFGPFHVEDVAIRAMGDCISPDGKGASCLFEGRLPDLRSERRNWRPRA